MKLKNLPRHELMKKLVYLNAVRPSSKKIGYIKHLLKKKDKKLGAKS